MSEPATPGREFAAVWTDTQPSCRTPEPGWAAQCRRPGCPGFWRTGIDTEAAAWDAFDEHWARVHVPAVIGPDPERDRRVAARRRDDASRAGRALDRLLASPEPILSPILCPRPAAHMADEWTGEWPPGHEE